MFRRPSIRYGTSPEPVTPYQRAAQVWDVQRTPAFPSAGQPFSVSQFTTPYTSALTPVSIEPGAQLVDDVFHRPRRRAERDQRVQQARQQAADQNFEKWTHALQLLNAVRRDRRR